MAGLFDELEPEPQQDVAPPPAWSFDDLQAEPETDSNRTDTSWLGNVGRGVVESAGDVAGNLAGFAANLGDMIEERVSLGGFGWRDGDILPSYIGPEEWASRDKEAGLLRQAEEAGTELDVGYDQNRSGTWEEDIKGAYEAGDYGRLALGLGPYVAQQFTASAPHMAAAMANLPAYAASLANDVASERAKKNGRELPDEQDLAIGTATGTLVAGFERFGITKALESFVPGGQSILAKIGKGAAAEGATEFGQEQIQYAGEEVGTLGDQWSLDQSLERGLHGAVVGAGGGGAVAGVGGALSKFRDDPTQQNPEAAQTLSQPPQATIDQNQGIGIPETPLNQPAGRSEQVTTAWIDGPAGPEPVAVIGPSREAPQTMVQIRREDGSIQDAGVDLLQDIHVEEVEAPKPAGAEILELVRQSERVSTEIDSIIDSSEIQTASTGIAQVLAQDSRIRDTGDRVQYEARSQAAFEQEARALDARLRAAQERTRAQDLAFEQAVQATFAPSPVVAQQTVAQPQQPEVSQQPVAQPQQPEVSQQPVATPQQLTADQSIPSDSLVAGGDVVSGVTAEQQLAPQPQQQVATQTQAVEQQSQEAQTLTTGEDVATDPLSTPSTTAPQAQAAAPGVEVDATPEGKVQRLAKAIQAEDLTAVNATAGTGATLREMGKLLKRDIVLVSGSKSFNAATLPGDPDTIFVHANSDSPLRTAVGHEYIHTVASRNPELFAELRNAMISTNRISDRDISDHRVRVDKQRAKLGLDPITEQLAAEELIADMSGSLFGDKHFWSELKAEKPAVFTRIARAVKRLIDRMIRGLTANKQFKKDHVRDLEATRDILSEAIRKQVSIESEKETEATIDGFYGKQGSGKTTLREQAAARKEGEVESDRPTLRESAESRRGETQQIDDKPTAEGSLVEDSVDEAGTVDETATTKKPTLREKREARKKQAKPTLRQRAQAKAEVQEATDADQETGTEEVLLSGQSEETFEAPTELTKGDIFKRTMIDKWVGLEKIQAAIEAAGNDITELNNAFRTVKLNPGRTQQRIDTFKETHLNPILEQVRESSLSLEDVGRYLHARHAKEANAVLEKRNPDRSNNTALSGMSNKDADAVLAEFDGDVEMEGIAERFDTMNRAKVSMLVSEGLLTKEEAAIWRRNYKHWVPLHRIDDNETVASPGRAFDMRGKMSKIRTGSNREVDHKNIITHAVADFEAKIKRAEKNRVSQALLALAVSNPNEDVWTIDNLPKGSPQLKADGTLAKTGVNAQAPNVVGVKLAGEQRYLVFNEANPVAMSLAETLKGMDKSELSPALVHVAKYTRFLSAMSTTYNPQFTITNFFRDLQTAAFNLSSTPLKGKEVSLLKGVPAAMKGIHNATRGDGKSEWAGWYKRLQKNGGTTGWSQMYSSIEHRYADIEKEVHGDSKGRAALKAIGQFVEDYNSIVENSMRLSVFRLGVERGLSEADAALVAKRLTVDFNQRGTAGANLNAGYMFANAGIQGNYRMIQNLQTPRGKKVATSLVVLGLTSVLINNLLDDELWDSIPEYVKARNWIFIDPLNLTEDGYYKIPKPYGYNLFTSLGEEIAEGYMSANGGKSDWSLSKSVGRLASSTVDNFSPVGAGPLEQIVAPTPLDWIVQNSTNTAWYGAPLYPDWNRHQPDHTKQRFNESKFAVGVAEGLADLTRDEQKATSGIDIAPALIDNFISFHTGGAGRTVMDISEMITLGFTGEMPDIRRTPFLSKVYGDAREGDIQRFFYDQYNDSLSTRTAIRKMAEGEQAEAKEKAGAHYELAEFAHKVTAKQLRKINKRIREAKKDKDRAELKKLKAEQFDIMQTYLDERSRLLFGVERKRRTLREARAARAASE